MVQGAVDVVLQAELDVGVVVGRSILFAAAPLDLELVPGALHDIAPLVGDAAPAVLLSPLEQADVAVVIHPAEVQVTVAAVPLAVKDVLLVLGDLQHTVLADGDAYVNPLPVQGTSLHADGRQQQETHEAQVAAHDALRMGESGRAVKTFGGMIHQGAHGVTPCLAGSASLRPALDMGGLEARTTTLTRPLGLDYTA